VTHGSAKSDALERQCVTPAARPPLSTRNGVADAASQIWGGPSRRKEYSVFKDLPGKRSSPKTKRSWGTLRRRRNVVLRTACCVQNLLRTSCAVRGTEHLFTPAAVPAGPLHPSDSFPKGRAMGSCRRDRSHRESQPGRIDYQRRRRPPCGGLRPCQIRHQCCGEKFLARKGTSPARRQPRSHPLISRYSTVKRFGPLFFCK
jgi:hypothetical protein